ncbi:MAG: patatin-like phospholipase family protein [Candidatus Eisenbacteria bacterium]
MTRPEAHRAPAPWRFALALALLGAGCAAHRPPTSVPLLIADAAEQRSHQAMARADVLDRVVRRIEARGDRTLDILVLSGGGQGGAYGAGFLRGWKSRTGDPMPTFDVVTGISTGALQAPFALLGTDSSLAYASGLYRSAVDRIKPSLDPLFFVKGTGGVLKRTKLEATIARIVDSTFAVQLRREFDADRTLLVGTTDLDLGSGHIWDIARELDTSPAGLARFRSLLIATSAIPGAFPPVVLDGHAHTDGGITTNLLLGADLEDFRGLAARLHERNFKEPVRVRLWVVVNLWIHPAVQVTNERSVRAIRGRGTALLYFSSQQFALTRLWELSSAVTTGVSGLTMEMHYTAAPDSFAALPAANKLLDRRFMEDLESAGYERARGEHPWDALPINAFARPEPGETR